MIKISSAQELRLSDSRRDSALRSIYTPREYSSPRGRSRLDTRWVVTRSAVDCESWSAWTPSLFSLQQRSLEKWVKGRC